MKNKLELKNFSGRIENVTLLGVDFPSHILSELEQIAACFGILHDGVIVKEVSAGDVL